MKTESLTLPLETLMHFPVGEATLDAKLLASEVLANHLADIRVLHAKANTFYWSLEGVNLTGVHTILDTQIEALEALIRPLSDQIRNLGSTPPGAFSELLALTRIKEAASAPVSGETAVQVLLQDHENCIASLLCSIDDLCVGTTETSTIECLNRVLGAHREQAKALRDTLDF